jgi:hypothetical protein
MLRPATKFRLFRVTADDGEKLVHGPGTISEIESKMRALIEADRDAGARAVYVVRDDHGLEIGQSGP